jgi:hypothetical protein
VITMPDRVPLRTSFLLTRLAFALVGFVLLSGCGSDGPKLVTVSGKVYFRDKPLAGVQVTFQPDEGSSPDARPAIDYTTPDGSFKLQTNNAGKGAMVGRYKVLITADQTNLRGLDKYSQPKTMTVTVDVPPGGVERLRNTAEVTEPSARFRPQKSYGTDLLGSRGTATSGARTATTTPNPARRD